MKPIWYTIKMVHAATVNISSNLDFFKPLLIFLIENFTGSWVSVKELQELSLNKDLTGAERYSTFSMSRLKTVKSASSSGYSNF